MSDRMLIQMIILIVIFAVIGFSFYGVICAIKRTIKKAKEKMQEEGFLAAKKGILDAVKLLFGAQVIGLLFYVTPAINENIKIILSLAMTLGALIFAFFIKEEKGINGTCRALAFIGQEFFGITMLLIMVNKGIGYSASIVFLLWTIFNFYILKKIGKPESKAFFWIMLGAFVISLLRNNINEIDSVVAIIVTCIILLGIHGFVKKGNIGTRFFSNFCFTLLMILVAKAIDSVDIGMVLFITIAFTVGNIIEQAFLKTVNFRAFLLYIPYVVILLLAEPTVEVIVLISLFNVIVSALLLSEKSVYKKLLSICFLLAICTYAEQWINIDELVYMIIYLSAVIFGYACLLTPVKSKKSEEIGEEVDDNEQE